MNKYQQGFTHACRLMKHMFEKNKTPITKEFQKLFNFVDENELDAIKRGIGVCEKKHDARLAARGLYRTL